MQTLDDRQLACEGINLQGVISAENAAACGSALKSGEQLLVFGHGGRQLWESLGANPAGDDPIDSYSIACVEGFMARHGLADGEVLYPGSDSRIDLVAVGQLLGWHFPSPAGLGIHPAYGLWSAVRVVLKTLADFAETMPPQEPSPCDGCAEKPCIRACPVGAVREGPFDMAACSDERVRGNSGCTSLCMARLACPVGARHRYDAQQVAYHYGRSLLSIRRYRANG